MFKSIVFVLVVLSLKYGSSVSYLYLSEYVVNINDSDITRVKEELKQLDLNIKTRVVRNVYILRRSNQANWSTTPEIEFTKRLKSCCHGKVIAVEQVVESSIQLWRLPAEPVNTVSGPSRVVKPTPLNQTYADIGVIDVWAQGITGKDVVIGVTDVGVNVDHPDLSRNIAKELCYNAVTGSNDVRPEYHGNYFELDKHLDHGTNSAGLIAALRNTICGDGVAFGAKVAGLKIFEVTLRHLRHGNSFSDAKASLGLSHAIQDIDIYSNSWSTMVNFAPHHFGLASCKALEQGVTMGRNKKGSIYVFPVGALGDGYSNSIFTVTVNEVIAQGHPRAGSKPCPCTLTSTYGESSTIGGTLKTASSYEFGNCTSNFKGTSAATAIVSGVIALVLEANPNVTWRDIQHLLVESSERTTCNLKSQDEFTRNGAGKYFHPKLGFGLLNAMRMVTLARNWTHVGKQISQRRIMAFYNCTPVHEPWRCSREVQMQSHARISRIEHVVVDISYHTPDESQTGIYLESSYGTVSTIMSIGQSVDKQQGRFSVTFMSVHFWGEPAEGSWKLSMVYNGTNIRDSLQLQEANITWYGTAILDQETGMTSEPSGKIKTALRDHGTDEDIDLPEPNTDSESTAASDRILPTTEKKSIVLLEEIERTGPDPLTVVFICHLCLVEFSLVFFLIYCSAH